MSNNAHKQEKKPQTIDKRPSQTGNQHEEDIFAQQPDLTDAAQQARLDPATLSPAAVLQLQRTIGNQAVLRLLAHRQPKEAETYVQPLNQQESDGEGRESPLIQRELSDQVAEIGDWPQQANDGEGRESPLIQRELSDQVGQINDWLPAAPGPFCTSAVWWWAAKEAAAEADQAFPPALPDLVAQSELAGKIPIAFSELKDLCDRKRRILFVFGGGARKTDLNAGMPADGTVLLWEGDNMVTAGGHHAAVARGGRICGYNQPGISEAGDAGSVYTELNPDQLSPVATSCYTIPAERMVAAARERILD